MTRSQLLANCHASKGTQLAHAIILDDGVILNLAVSGPTMDKVIERLGDRLIESAISDDGFCFAAIISAQDWHESLGEVAEEVNELTYTDNRKHTCHDLAGFIGMAEWLEQARQFRDVW